jgi:hypothetical protein
MWLVADAVSPEGDAGGVLCVFRVTFDLAGKDLSRTGG